MNGLLRALPDVVRLTARLVADPALPVPAKVALAVALAYLVSPIDIVPDFIPFLGYLDDLLLAAVLVDGILNHVDRALILKHWPGTPEGLDRIARVARVLAVWVPSALKTRVFSGQRR